MFLCDLFQHAIHRNFLIKPERPTAALVGTRHGIEAIPPRVRLGVGHRPEFLRRGIRRDLAFRTRLHLDGIDAAPVGGVGVADRQLGCVIFGLPDALGEFFVPRLRFDNGELGVAIDQHIIRDVRLPSPAATFDAASRDTVLAQDFTSLHDTPPRRFQCGVDVFGSGFGFVHGWFTRRRGDAEGWGK